MNDIDKEKYKITDTKKNEQIKNSCSILNQFIELSVQNWNNHNKQIYDGPFLSIEDVVKDNPYGSFDKMLEEIGE